MADMATALRTYLLTKSAVTDLVTARIYPEVLDQNATMPAIVLREISGVSFSGLETSSGIAQTRLQIDCYHTVTASAKACREAVRVSIPFNGTQGKRWGDETIYDLEHENFHTREEPPMDGSNTWRYVAAFDVLVSHAEAVPA